MNYLEKENNNTIKYLAHLRKIDINYKIEEFVKNVNIPLTLNCNEKDKKFFSISQKVPKNEIMKIFTLKKDSIIIKDIQGFIDNFPNFINLYQEQDSKNENLLKFLSQDNL